MLILPEGLQRHAESFKVQAANEESIHHAKHCALEYILCHGVIFDQLKAHTMELK